MGESTLINEVLDLKKIQKLDSKVRFQVALTEKVSLGFSSLVDVGSGSGRFLFHCKNIFQRKLGIEADSRSREFSKRILDLNIDEKIKSEIFKSADLVTFWHSFEHFSEEMMTQCLSSAQHSENSNLRLVICLPNVESLHYRIFGEKSVYYDFQHHPHQFSTTSLQTLLKKFGFEIVSRHTSWAYSLMGNALSIVNKLTSDYNFLYMTIVRGQKSSNGKLLFHLCLLGTSLPLALALYLYEATRPQNGAVLTAVFMKK